MRVYWKAEQAAALALAQQLQAEEEERTARVARWRAEARERARRLGPSVTIAGAQGINAVIVNGTYDPAEGTTGGQPHYLKRGPGDRWLAYCSSDKEWWVQKAENRGTGIGFAYIKSASGWGFIKSDSPRPPYLTPGAWQVYDGAQWGEQLSVHVSEVSPPLRLLLL